MTDKTPQAEAALPAVSVSTGMPPAMAMWLDDKMFERARLIAKYLADARGFVPDHLAGNPFACMAVVSRALTWRLDPYAVASSTYSTPGGRVGFEGRLCQAILENSGKLEGGVRFRHFGDWSQVLGKFEVVRGAPKNGREGKEYPRRTWGPADAVGLGVVVSAQVRGEAQPRELEMLLAQCFPLNSTLWATDPKTQICYTAVRRFASVAVPGLLMGVPFDDDWQPGTDARDITPPRPVRPDVDEAFAKAPGAAPAVEEEEEGEAWELVSADGVVRTFPTLAGWLAAARKELAEPLTLQQLAGWYEANDPEIDSWREGIDELRAAAAQVDEMFRLAREAAERRDRRPAAPEGAGGATPTVAEGQPAGAPAASATGQGPDDGERGPVQDAPREDPASAASPAPPRDGDLLSGQQQSRHDYPELYRWLVEGLQEVRRLDDLYEFLRVRDPQVQILKGDGQLHRRWAKALAEAEAKIKGGRSR